MKKYIRLLWIEFRKVKEYSLNFLGELIYLPFTLVIIYFIWSFVFKNTKMIANYSFNDIIGYYFLLSIFESAISPIAVTAYEIWSNINYGQLNLYLSRPINYPLYVLVRKFGFFVWGLISGMLFLIVVDVVLPLNFYFHIGRFSLSILSAFLGLLIMFNLYFCIGSMTFWVENILTLRDNLWDVIRILSGQLFPLALFPSVLRNLAEALPFQYIYFVPISIFQGKIETTTLKSVLFSQTIWVLCLTVLSVWVWKTGIKKYSAQGG